MNFEDWWKENEFKLKDFHTTKYVAEKSYMAGKQETEELIKRIFNEENRYDQIHKHPILDVKG